MTTKAERSARISELCTALRNERLASIRDDLADLGYPAAESITAHYHLSEEYGWPVLNRLDIDGQLSKCSQRVGVYPCITALTP